MATFVSLFNLTDQGVRAFKDTTKRAGAFARMAEGAGVTVKELFWTLGAYDGVVIFEAPDDQTATSVMLSLAGSGNVRAHTLRAFNREEMEAIIAKA